MRILYIDCIGGVAGDMLLAALLDAGAEERTVRAALADLNQPGWELSSERVERGGISALALTVTADGSSTVERDHESIAQLLRASALQPEVKERSLRTFDALASAEGKVHGVLKDRVHFHEVGGIDAIIDIVGACAAIEDLAPDRIVASAIPTGRGFVGSAHGKLPLPAPAVVELLGGAELFERGNEELVTPTGAALLAANCDSFGPMPRLRLVASGYGAGRRDTEVPNVVRVLIGEGAEDHPAARQTIELLETNIDDMNPELVPYVIERLLDAGAVDAWVTPIQMKKGRVGFLLSILAGQDAYQRMLDILFAETTTFGVRISPVEREVLDRKEVEVEVEGRRVRLKVGYRAGEVVTVAPEYDDAVAVARATGIPLKDVYRAALDAL